MKRKISILSLTFLFFAATTGLPVTLHVCKMMNIVSSEACEMHKAKEVKNSCCEEVQSDYPVKLTSDQSCCYTELINNKVKDDFLSFKTETTNNPVLIAFTAETINQLGIISTSNSSLFYSDTSPPFLSNNHIYINISLLLI